MSDYYTILTDIGIAKLANALALGQTVNLTEFAVGDGGEDGVYNPTSSQTALKNETYRAPVNAISIDEDNPSWLIIEAVVPAQNGGWYVREAGIFDDDGDMIAIIKYPETFKPQLEAGVGKDLYLRSILEHSNVAQVTLKIDPAVVLASRDFVRKAVQQHAASTDHPAATELTQGMSQIATQEQVDTGDDDTAFVTPKKLRWGISWLFAAAGYIVLPSWLGSFKIQWSTTTTSASGVLSVTYPMAFEGVPGAVVATASTGAQSIATVQNPSKTNFGLSCYLHDGSRISNAVSWIAIGR